MKFKFLIKEEGNFKTFLAAGEYYEVVTSSTPSILTARELEFFDKTLFVETDPITMHGFNGATLSLPTQAHRASGIDKNKQEAKFTIRLVEGDFDNFVFTELKIWEFDVKQWPNGHVKITTFENNVQAG